MLQLINNLIQELAKITDKDQRVEYINVLNNLISEIHPFGSEPISNVQWVKHKNIHSNDYNPNSVANPEMELLKLSISKDGYTQPIVTSNAGNQYEIVDGFHRYSVGKGIEAIETKLNGYLPVVKISSKNEADEDRMASTVRHNRARGKHSVELMSEMVVSLKKRGKDKKWISEHLGMDEEEVCRLSQISGLTEYFENQEYSKSWDVESFLDEDI
jgi:ParB-like chromosome segregation protein Spo0J